MSYYNPTSGYILDTRDRMNTSNRERAAKANEKRMSLYEQNLSNANARQKYTKFLSEAKDLLMVEGLFRLYENCLPTGISDTLKKYGKSIVTNFVTTENTNVLLNTFKTKSQLLSEFASIVENSYNTIIEKVDCNDINSICVRNSDLNSFLTKIDGMTDSGITQVIGERISKAEEKMVNSSIEDKAKLEALATKTQEKIDSVKVKDADVEEGIKQEYARMYHEATHKVQERSKSILESIVLRMSREIMKNDSIRAGFISESGRLDMNNVIEISEVMYGFLEMVNTLNIKNVNEAYLSTVLSSIK